MDSTLNSFSTDALLNMDATEIAHYIKAKKLTSEFITRTYINHINKVNPILNAVVENRFDLAIEEAIQCDQENNKNKMNLPLFGVPISIKESFNVKGMHTTGGIVHRKDIRMNEDALAVKLLKEAGAIILCKTNTPALCFCQETDNKLFGRTNNPWNLRRTAGGSSGGEAALISTGASAIGLGSDIGGSIRFPSHFNGVVGFKPGAFQVDATGHFPKTSIPLQKHMLGVGPLGKSVRDMKLFYNIIVNNHQYKSLYEKMDIDILPVDNGYPLSDNTKELMTKLTNFLKKSYDTVEALPPYFHDSARIWQEIMAIDGAKEIKRITFNTDRANVWKAFMKEKLTQNTSIHTFLSWAIIGANMFKPSKKRINEIDASLKHGQKELDHYFNNRLLIFPVHHTAAPNHGELYNEVFSINKTYLKYLPYITYANVFGLPALTVPIGYDDDGLPIGIQIIGRIGNEDSIFRLGEVIEKEFGGYKRSTLLD